VRRKKKKNRNEVKENYTRGTQKAEEKGSQHRPPEERKLGGRNQEFVFVVFNFILQNWWELEKKH